MRYRLRQRWAAYAGVLLALLVIGLGAVGVGRGVVFDMEGIGSGAVAVAMTVLAAFLALQWWYASRQSLQRERRLVRTAAQLREATAALDRLARTDPLTNLLNRRAFFDLLGVEFRRSRRYARDMTVLMLDLDDFKRVNDRWGHPFGDYVLEAVARLMTENLRESDIVGRYGGEEFVVVLTETGPEPACLAAEKLRKAIEDFEFRHNGTPPAGEPPVRLTVSVGLAALPVDAGRTEMELIERADRCLYDAKRAGKNRVHLDGKGVTSAGPPAPHAEESGAPAL